MKAIILAGKRSGKRTTKPHPLTPVAGKPSLLRVTEALDATHCVDGGLVVGPADGEQEPKLAPLWRAGRFRWLAPADGPAESACIAARHLDEWPLLLTTGDHALLQAAWVDRFCADAAHRAETLGLALVTGLVPYERVRQRFPHARRTRLRFSDGSYCGSNLFWMQNAEALRALAFWRRMQALRKHPWRLAGRIDFRTLIRYWSGRLTLDDALNRLSWACGCRVGWAPVADPRAAVDVDSASDLALAESLLQ